MVVYVASFFLHSFIQPDGHIHSTIINQPPNISLFKGNIKSKYENITNVIAVRLICAISGHLRLYLLLSFTTFLVMVQISKYKITAVIGEGSAALLMLRKLFISKSTEYVFALNYSTSGKRK